MADDSNNSNATHFNNPIDETEKIEVLMSLACVQTDVKIYMEQKLFESKTFPTNDPNKITVLCSESATDKPFKSGKDLTCHFMLHKEIFFFTSTTTFTNTSIVFAAPKTIYKVQRRDNFRVYVPQHMPQKIELVGHKLKVTLLDLSLGGCKVTLNYTNPDQILNQFKPGSEVGLKMTFLSFDNQLVYCKVKFLRDQPDKKSASLGLEFEKLKAEETQAMQANIFKIDRLSRQRTD